MVLLLVVVGVVVIIEVPGVSDIDPSTAVPSVATLFPGNESVLLAVAVLAVASSAVAVVVASAGLSSVVARSPSSPFTPFAVPPSLRSSSQYLVPDDDGEEDGGRGEVSSPSRRLPSPVDTPPLPVIVASATTTISESVVMGV